MAEGLSVGVSEVEVVMEAEWLSGRGQSERTWVRVHGVPLLLWQWNSCYSNEKQCYWFHPKPNGLEGILRQVVVGIVTRQFMNAL